MIVTACPLDDNADETLCTLTFAARVRSITLTPANSAVKAKNMEQVKALLNPVASQSSGGLEKFHHGGDPCAAADS